jgi:hypothetical protein
MQIEIRKPVGEYPKQKWEFLLVLLQTPALLICLLIFLLLVVCESYYRTKSSSEHATTDIGGVFSVCGFILLFGIIANTFKNRKKYRMHMTPKTERYYVMLTDNGCERGIENLWSENKNWRLLTGYRERDNAFWLEFGQAEFPIFKYEFKQPADIDEFREFLNKKIG